MFGSGSVGVIGEKLSSGKRRTNILLYYTTIIYDYTILLYFTTMLNCYTIPLYYTTILLYHATILIYYTGVRVWRWECGWPPDTSHGGLPDEAALLIFLQHQLYFTHF